MPHVNYARMVQGAKLKIIPWRLTGYTVRFFAASTKIYPEKNPGHFNWLARVKDLSGNTYVNN